MLNELRIQEQAIKDKIDFYANWLVKNFDNPDRGKIVADKNALSVKLSTIRFKIKNVQAGEPILGYGEDLNFYEKITEVKRTSNN
ncbi:MAG TPA: hypothetical protein VN698_09640 [Bacteroidia bacterium]|nr:hypothetical protein [Bacteroidia bacterium]